MRACQEQWCGWATERGRERRRVRRLWTAKPPAQQRWSDLQGRSLWLQAAAQRPLSQARLLSRPAQRASSASRVIRAPPTYWPEERRGEERGEAAAANAGGLERGRRDLCDDRTKPATARSGVSRHTSAGAGHRPSAPTQPASTARRAGATAGSGRAGDGTTKRQTGEETGHAGVDAATEAKTSVRREMSGQ